MYWNLLGKLSMYLRPSSIFKVIRSPHFCIVHNDNSKKLQAMTTFNVPQRGDVSVNNQEIFDQLKKGLGMVPNLYAVMAHSDTALANYLTFQNAKTSFSNKEKQSVNLVVSQVNECLYCQSAHTLLGTMNGLTQEQTIEIRKGSVSFDEKLNSLVTLAKAISTQKGFVEEELLENFFRAGYSKGQAVELVMLVAEKTAMNFLHALTNVEIDFPVAKAI
jgi:AhpD family alkylhydroperoxidase